MPDNARAVARRAVQSYRRTASFAGGIGSVATHSLGLIDEPSSLGLGPLSLGVRRRARLVAVREANREAGRQALVLDDLPSRPIDSDSLEPNAVRRRVPIIGIRQSIRESQRQAIATERSRIDLSLVRSVDLWLTHVGRLNIRQRVRPSNIDEFYGLLENAVTQVQLSFNRAYELSARADSNKEYRSPKIRRLISAVLGLASRIMPNVGPSIQALEAIASSGSNSIGALRLFSKVMQAIIDFIDSSLSECASSIIANIRNSVLSLVSWSRETERYYSATSISGADRVQLGLDLANDYPSVVSNIVSSTLIGHRLAAISGPVSWAIEQVNSWIDDNLSALTGAISVNSGRLISTLICSYENLLNGQVGLGDLGFSNDGVNLAAPIPSLSSVLSDITRETNSAINSGRLNRRQIVAAFSGRGVMVSSQLVLSTLERPVGRSLLYRAQRSLAQT